MNRVVRVLLLPLVAIAIAGCGGDESKPSSPKEPEPAPARTITTAQELGDAAASESAQRIEFTGVVLQAESVPVQTIEVDASGDESTRSITTDGATTIRYVRLVPGPLIDEDGAATELGAAIKPWTVDDVVLVVGGPQLDGADAVTVTANVSRDYRPIRSFGLDDTPDFVQAEAVSVDDATELVLGSTQAAVDEVDDVLLGDTELAVSSLVRTPTYWRFRVQPDETLNGFCESYTVAAGPPAPRGPGAAAAQAVARAFSVSDAVDFPPSGWTAQLRAVAAPAGQPGKATWSCSKSALRQLADIERENAQFTLTEQEQAVQDAIVGEVVSHPQQQTTTFPAGA